MTFLAAVLSVGISGCALMNDTPPSVDVTDIRLIGLGLTEQRLAMTLCVTNPNINQIAFRRVTADLDVSGAPLATGASDLSVVLPPRSSTAVPFTVVTTVRNIGPQLLGVFRTGSVDSRVHGTVTFQGALGLTLPYSRSGGLDPLAGGLDLANAAGDSMPSRCSAPPGGPQA